MSAQEYSATDDGDPALTVSDVVQQTHLTPACMYTVHSCTHSYIQKVKIINACHDLLRRVSSQGTGYVKVFTGEALAGGPGQLLRHHQAAGSPGGGTRAGSPVVWESGEQLCVFTIPLWLCGDC